MLSHSLLIKKIYTIFFLVFLVMVAVCIPTSALINNPIFLKDNNKFFYVNPQNFNIYQSQGFTLSNIMDAIVIVPTKKVQELSLYDLYLGFEGKDFTNNYAVIKNYYETNNIQMKEGKYSAKFLSGKNGIILLPEENSILNNKFSSFQNFTITFDLYPYRSGEGVQTIASYLGNHDDPVQGLQSYGFSITIEKGFIVYHFSRFFIDKANKTHDFILRERLPLIDTKWEKHSLVMNTAKNTIKIYRNGTEEDVRLISEEQSYSGDKLYLSPVLKQIDNIPLVIGKNSIFSIDEFTIYKDALTNLSNSSPYTQYFLETDVLRMSTNISILRGIDISASLKDKIHYRMAYRISDEYFLPGRSTIGFPWVYVDPQKNMFPPSKSMGKYIQWRVEYFEDSSFSDQDFFIYNIYAQYKEISSPGVVTIDEIITYDQTAELLWKALPSELVASYEIYYGDKPRHYFGTAKTSPSSPISIDVKQSATPQEMYYKLEGLKNEKSYYLSVRAKDIYGQYGPYSDEIVFRPSSLSNKAGYSIGR